MDSRPVLSPTASIPPMHIGLGVRNTSLGLPSSSLEIDTGIAQSEQPVKPLSGRVDVSEEIRKIWQAEKLKHTSASTSKSPARCNTNDTTITSLVQQASPLQYPSDTNSKSVAHHNNSPLTSVATSTGSRQLDSTPQEGLRPSKLSLEPKYNPPYKKRSPGSSPLSARSDSSSRQTIAQPSQTQLLEITGNNGSVLKDLSENRTNMLSPSQPRSKSKIPLSTPAIVTTTSARKIDRQDLSISPRILSSNGVSESDHSHLKITNYDESNDLSSAKTLDSYQLGRLSFETPSSDNASCKSQSSGGSDKSSKSSKVRHSQMLRWNKAPPGKNMIYYPAPVPMSLNLPRRLSPQSATASSDSYMPQITGSKSAKEGEIMYSDKSAQHGHNSPASSTKSPYKHQIEVQHGSAVATLESFLDASVNAPVARFTTSTSTQISGAQNQHNVQIPSSHNDNSVDDNRMTVDEADDRVSMHKLKSMVPPDADKRGCIIPETSVDDTARWAQDLWTDAKQSQPILPKLNKIALDRGRQEVSSPLIFTSAYPELPKERSSQQALPSAIESGTSVPATMSNIPVRGPVAQKEPPAQRTLLPWEEAIASHRGSRSLVERDEDRVLGITKEANAQHEFANSDRPLDIPENSISNDNKTSPRRRNRLQKRNPNNTEGAMTASPDISSNGFADSFSSEVLRELGVPIRPVLPQASNSAPELPYFALTSPTLPNLSTAFPIPPHSSRPATTVRSLSTASPTLPNLASTPPKLPPVPAPVAVTHSDQTRSHQYAVPQQESAVKPLPLPPTLDQRSRRAYDNHVSIARSPPSHQSQPDFRNSTPKSQTLPTSTPTSTSYHHHALPTIPMPPPTNYSFSEPAPLSARSQAANKTSLTTATSSQDFTYNLNPTPPPPPMHSSSSVGHSFNPRPAPAPERIPNPPLQNHNAPVPDERAGVASKWAMIAQNARANALRDGAGPSGGNGYGFGAQM